MLCRVVDSNVPIVANGRETNASLSCRLRAIECLNTILNRGQIVIDDAGEILAEYRRYCNPRGQPGVGDRFFREILMNYEGKVRRVLLEKTEDGDFVDFPNAPALAAFDPSDKKFAAAARKTNTPVLNATDSDWLEYRAALQAFGIEIDFVCSDDQSVWHI